MSAEASPLPPRHERTLALGSTAYRDLMGISVEADEALPPDAIEIRKNGETIKRLRLVDLREEPES